MHHPAQRYPVVDDASHLYGMVARADVLRWTRDGWPTGQSLADVVGESDCIKSFSDELVGQLADRMAAAKVGRVPILRRSNAMVVGLVARRDQLRVRTAAIGQERERKALIRLRKFQPSTDAKCHC